MKNHQKQEKLQGIAWAERALPALEYAASWLYPRRCPLCGTILDCSAAHELHACLCAACAAAARRREHNPPRLPETEHCLYSLAGAAAAYYYEDEIRSAILLCKNGGNPWYARELADLMAVKIFGAQPAKLPGKRPVYVNASGIPLYSAVVPVPPRDINARGFSLPELLAKRLGRVLGIPCAGPLKITRALKEQKQLGREDRMKNTRGAYTAAGADLAGQRILLVDDIITTGSTVSACAQALMLAGAFDVFAVCVAADEERKKEQSFAMLCAEPF